jgi:hypothetical protein
MHLYELMAVSINIYYCKSVRRNPELVVRQSPVSKNVNTEAEEATVLEAVIRQPVKTQHTGEDLVHAVVNCRVRELATAL